MQGDQIVAQLTEMFGDSFPHGRILEACIKTEYDLQASIDVLLTNPIVTIEPSLITTTIEPVQSESISTNKTNLGAVKKLQPPKKQILLNNSGTNVSFSSFLKQGVATVPQNDKKTHSTIYRNPLSNHTNITNMINKGHRMMIIMRGAPGSGKSYLAKQFVDQTTVNANYRNHIFSADDYFMINGHYRYQVDKLEEAHLYVQNQVQNKAREGWSPILIDNTNIKLWEMFPYIKIAVDNGYHIEIVEPSTRWKNSARVLAIKNTHFVPEHKIKIMLNNYDRLTDVAEILKILKLEHHLQREPKLRHYPIFNFDVNAKEFIYKSPVPAEENLFTPVELIEKDVLAMNDVNKDEWVHNWETELCGDDDVDVRDTRKLEDIPLPKPPRFNPANTNPFTMSEGELLAFEDPIDLSEKLSALNLLPTKLESITTNKEADKRDTNEWGISVNQTNWKAFDEEAGSFWGISTPKNITEDDPKPKRNLQLACLSDITIPAEWKNDQKEKEVQKIVSELTAVAATEPLLASNLEKHKRGCEHENKSFFELCNLYSSVPVDYLWDLFEKCTGDGDWTANLLLEEMKTVNFEKDGANPVEEFTCKCNDLIRALPVSEDWELSSSNSASPKTTIRRKDKNLSDEILNAKKMIEESFVLGSQHYSNKMKKVRDTKRGIKSETVAETEEKNEIDLLVDIENDNHSSDNENGADDLIEITLGTEMVTTLHALFNPKDSENKPDLTNVKSNVFMTKQMAEQIYHLWLETLYNYNEEERKKAIKLDAEYANMIDARQKYPLLYKMEEKTNDTPNLKDIIDMEYALSAYKLEMEVWKKSAPQDMAANLTRQKLCELFPNVPSETLFEILVAHDNKFEDTVKVLKNSLQDEINDQIAKESYDLFKRAQLEAEKVVQGNTTNESKSKTITESTAELNEEAISGALKDVEDCRNLASHHSELKVECYEKARNAIQRGIPGVAHYYSQIASLHRTKIDMYNHKASNCIMEVHKLTQNNADVLDLHHLHSDEALHCLELFLSQHASRLPRLPMHYKELFIITGRGLHSAAGIPIIKYRVKGFLKEKGLKFVEINPGFLKVKIYNNTDLDKLL